MNTVDTPPIGYPELGEFEERMLALAEATAATAAAASGTNANVRTVERIVVFWLVAGLVAFVVVAAVSSAH